MVISYEIILTIINITNDETRTFNKNFSFTLDNLNDKQLYNNHHLISNRVNMFALFIVSGIFNGFEISSWQALVVSAIILSLINLC